MALDSVSRRSFLATGIAAALTGALSRTSSAAVVTDGPGRYGPLGPVDPQTGLQLPAGFTSRVVARYGELVRRGDGTSSAYRWHIDPDGGAVFGLDDGGWVYVSNSEEIPGGAGAIRFAPDGQIRDAYRILDGTRNNCAGGATPWGTWLSCEEVDLGLVHECHVDGPGSGAPRPALGAFRHEAVTVDPVGQRLYLTEDAPTGRLYRFTPTAYPDLSVGLLEAAACAIPPPTDPDGIRTWTSTVTWIPVSPATPASTQPAGALTTRFDGGEGIWYDADRVWFTTKGDNRVWELDVRAQRLSIIYDDSLWPAGAAPLDGVDNVTVSPAGDLFVAEDHPAACELVTIATIDGVRQVTPFARIADHTGTEITGPAFSPDGTRLYFSSQRGPSAGGASRGVTYEVTGPFVPEGGGTLSNPVDRYIDAVHLLFVQRLATASEHEQWRLSVARGDRDPLTRALATSSEFAGTRIDDLYRSILGRSADGPGRAYWLELVRTGTRLDQVAAYFYGSTEFYRASGSTNGGFVDALYRDILGRSPDPSGRAYWTDLLDRRRLDRSGVAAALYASIESRRDRVRAQYLLVLGRRPDAAGLAYWVEQIVRLGDIALAATLAASLEYYRRATA